MSAKYLVAAILAALVSAPLCAQSVKAGIDAWQRADYEGAVTIWRPLAEKGDADAQFNLGQAYRLGRGVPINLALAKGWFERAAASGHLDAETTLGLLLFQNGDQAAGLKWLKEAAEQGEPRAQLVYGTALYNGDGVTQDRMLGYSYVSRAAGQGLVPARDTLAQLDELMPALDRKKAIAMSVPKAAAAPKPSKPIRVAEAPQPKPGVQHVVRPAKALPAKTATPKPQSPRAAPGPATGNWRIQLGAFSQRGAAEALYHRISGKPALSGRGPYYIAAGQVTRLQVGPFESRAAAEAACHSAGTACFPVPAK
ncbi:MAG TPA: SPOR domain-containing protein [Sphingomicrobium sp.]|nr:SPOR domain-containing protein [Sphingomicrobium sp.]